MRITLLQTDIFWENKSQNLDYLEKQLTALCGQTDLVILPEMFSTGFSMQAKDLAETNEGPTITTLRQWAQRFQLALTGSFIATDSACNNSSHTSEPHYYNRGFFLTPEGEAYYYDKHHLFRMGEESKHFTPGNTHTHICYKGFHILLLICYDLRFPVWSRNLNLAYDLLIYVANWPASRRKAWDVLLTARAIENLCYVAGVNRVGIDGQGLLYDGGTALYSPKGEQLATVTHHQTDSVTCSLSLDELQNFRKKFPAWKDADDFKLME